MTPQEKKALAVQLRQAGHTYKEIAQQTGYSVDWCKHNLKEVQKNKDEKDVIKDCIKLAQSQTGITSGQIKRAVQLVYPYQEGKEYAQLEEKAIRRFRTAINKAPNTVIRPYWMQPQLAKFSLDTVLSAIDCTMQHMNDTVDHVRKQLNLDQSYDKSVRHAIISMLYCGGASTDVVVATCERWSESAIQLEKVNPSHSGGPNPYTSDAPIEYCSQKCTLSSPVEEKCNSVELHHSDELDVDLINNLIAEAYEPD
jgi:hypothetical protein